ncbi:ferritin-like domain-containing protein [Pedobacter sp.]|uniref:ferritin-like domain-containing protein n=1 Tax=Pedobacter sp. TaxID=1411316 RepID=UPI00396C4003
MSNQIPTKADLPMKSERDHSGMPNSHLHELFVDELRDILGAEKQLLKGLKKMAEKAVSNTLKIAFSEHHTETAEQIERLKQIFMLMNLSVTEKKCEAMEGLLNEADEIIEDFEYNEALDAALIVTAQKIEHYEIASYGCLITYASLMEHEEAKGLLEITLAQEKETDRKLTHIAVSEANITA